MTYDSTDGYVLQFGGVGPNSYVTTNQTWVFQAGNWTNLSGVGVAPPGRAWASLADDPTDGGVLLFGGYQVNWSGFQTLLSDSWWFSGGVWKQLSVGINHPTGRVGAPASAGLPGQGVLLFGGQTWGGGTTYLSDTWSFRNGSWSRLAENVSPSARGYAGMAYDPSSQSIVLVSGLSSGYPIHDAWQFTSEGWSKITPPANIPPAMEYPSMAYSSRLGGLVLVGALMTYPWAFQEWRYVGGVWTEANATDTPPAPTAGWEAVVASEPSGGGVVLQDNAQVGGCGPSTLRADSGAWSSALYSYGPSPCVGPGAAMDYDARDGYVVVFGGSPLGSPGTVSNETWTYSGGTWTELFPLLSPPARSGGALSYDASDGYLVLFGGASTYVYLSDTWAFSGGTWTNLTGTAGTGPAPRDGASMAWDASDGYLVLTGGYGTEQAVYSDTWTFSSGRWSDLTTTVSGSPGARGDASLAYDPDLGGLFLFGGEHWLGFAWTGLAAPMVYSGGTWTALTTSGPSPAPRAAPAMTYDSSLGGILLVGGENLSQYTGFSDVWLLQNSNWSAVNLTGGMSPLPSIGSELTWDGADGSILLFGGSQASTTLADAWSIGPLLGSPTLTVSPSVSEVGAPISVDTQLSGGSHYTHVQYSGLPPGCASDGTLALACSPTAAGAYSIGVIAYDPASRTQSSTSVRLNVAPALALVRFSVYPASLDLGGTVRFVSDVTGGVGPLTLAYDGLPPGCPGLDSTVVSCIPSSAGSYSVVLNASDALGHSEVSVLSVKVVADPVIVSASVGPGTIDAFSDFAVVLVASLGTPPYRYSYAGLPLGCPSSDLPHLICGTTAPGRYTIEATVTDALGVSDSTNLSLVVHPLPNVVALIPSASSVSVGEPLSVSAQVYGGTTPYTFNYTVKPGGCTRADAPAIECAPTVPGEYLVALKVTDALGQSAFATTQFNATETSLAPPPAGAPPAPPDPNGSLFLSLLPSDASLVYLLIAALVVATVFVTLRRQGPRRPREGRLRRLLLGRRRD